MSDKGLIGQYDKIIQWTNEGLSQAEMAKKLGVSQSAISYHVRKLRAEGKLSESKKTRSNSEEREKRYEQIIKWYSEGISQREMAERLGITKSVVAEYISFLAKQGRVKEWTEIESEKLEKKLKRTIWLYNRGVSNNEIAKTLGVSNSTVGNYIAQLKKEGRIPLKKPISVKQREMYDKIIELYYKGFTQDEIAQELGKSKEYINSCIVKLRKKGGLQESRPMSIKERKLRMEVAKLYEEGKTTKEISEQLGISTSAVENRIAKLKAEEKITDKSELNRTRKEKLFERIRQLYNAGCETEVIAEKLGIAPSSAQQYISELRKQGLLADKTKIKRKRIEERYKLIIKLYYDGASISDMAKKTGVSEGTIRKNLAILRERNELPDIPQRKTPTKSNSEEREKEYRQIIDLYNQYLSIEEISEKTGLSSTTVRRYISITIEEGRLKARNEKRVKTKAKQAKRKEIAERREKIIVWYNEGITIEEIAKRLGVNRATVSKDVKSLIKKGKISSTSPRVESRKEEKSIQNEIIIEMHSKGATADAIAQELGLTRNTVYGYIGNLRKQGLIPPAKRKKKETKVDDKESRKNQYIRLHSEGKTAKEMAEIMGVAIETVYSRLYELRKEGAIPPAEKKKKKTSRTKTKNEPIKKTNDKNREEPTKRQTIQEQVTQLHDEGHTKSEISEMLKIPYDRVNDILNNRSRKPTQADAKIKMTNKQTERKEYSEEELYQISKAIKRHGYPDKEVRFLVDQYIKRKMYWECINFLNSYSQDKVLSKKQQITLEKLKKLLIELKDKPIRRKSNKDGQAR